MRDHLCRNCKVFFQSPYPRQLYCEPCSESADLKRKRLDKIVERSRLSRDAGRDAGIEISKEYVRGVGDPLDEPKLEWIVRICVPFSYAGSKNAIYRMVRRGHVALRRETKDYRAAIITAITRALDGRPPVQNKLWIDIHVEKSNHKGDAVNFVDTICDALKVATGVDDRWFCIRHLDWSINKSNPKLIIGIGQESFNPVQACSYCGRLLTFDKFHKNRHGLNGIARTCIECKVAGRQKK